jgi:hypothetical protein
VEYGKSVDLSREITLAIGLDRAKADNLLLKAGIRAAQTLRLNYNPIRIDASGVRAIDFAGLIRLAPNLELEIAPKFLGLEDGDAKWREDFFYLATLSKHGRLLASEHLSASGGTPRDLATLVARSITSMYATRKRRPLRSYRKVKESDFFIEGDPDPLDLIFPSPDGFEQELMRFDRRNIWNSDITGAAKELLPEVRDPTAADGLTRLIEDLAPQSSPNSRRKPIPARHKVWKPLHELSVDVLNGLGLSYKNGQAQASGYLVDTWRVWEDLLTIGIRLAFGSSVVKPQMGFFLGTKTKSTVGSISKLSVYPDCLIESDGSRPRILFDAKYKNNIEKGQPRIAEADIYEALAFSRATKCELIVLAYPTLGNEKISLIGNCSIFEVVQVDSVKILGVQIECRMISQSNGLNKFSKNLLLGILSVIR